MSNLLFVGLTEQRQRTLKKWSAVSGLFYGSKLEILTNTLKSYALFLLLHKYRSNASLGIYKQLFDST